ncbi:MAG TPA: hypothetical protein PKO28_02460 [Bacilli bacterium]|nr:hypothetical protein [Bacilli bacterium]HPS18625.1 hypothetical protein [Bacilli bacterium]
MKKKILITTLLVLAMPLTACQYAKIISMKEARELLNDIYLAQEAVNDETLVFSIKTEFTSNNKDETEGYIEKSTVTVSYPKFFFHEERQKKDLDGQLLADDQNYVFFNKGIYYIAEQTYANGAYERTYTQHAEMSDFLLAHYQAVISKSLRQYKGIDLKDEMLDEETGFLSEIPNTIYDYIKVKTTSASSDNLTVKYRTIDKEKKTIVKTIEWDNNYLKEIEYQFSDGDLYEKSKVKFSTKVDLRFPILNDYTPE